MLARPCRILYLRGIQPFDSTPLLLPGERTCASPHTLREAAIQALLKLCQNLCPPLRHPADRREGRPRRAISLPPRRVK